MQPISIITNKIKIHPWLFSVLPVLLAVIFIYLPDLKNGFVWDDKISFFGDPMYRDPENIKKALTGALIYQQNYFRPLPVLSFLVQIHVFNLTAARMHMVSILIHAINTLLIMLIVIEFLQRLKKPHLYVTSIIIGLIYGLHPALIEPVSFISSRFDMMMTMFLLFALYADIRLKNHMGRAFMVGLMFLLAALSKEMALGFVFALPFWHLARSEQQWPKIKNYWNDLIIRGHMHAYVSIFLFGLVYLLLRYKALGFLYDSSYYKNPLYLDLYQHISLVGYSAYKYFTLLFFPLGKITIAHPLPAKLDFSNYQVLIGFVILIGLPAMAFAVRKNTFYFLAGLLMVVGSLFPVLGIILVPRNPSMYFAESFLTFPVAVLVLALSYPVNLLLSKNSAISRNTSTAMKSGIGLWLLLSAFTVVTTIPIWKSDFTLWKWAIAVDPGNDESKLNLVSALNENQQYKQAVHEANNLLTKYPENDVLWKELATALAGLGDFAQAKSAAEKAVDLNAGRLQNRMMLAQIEYLNNDYKSAESNILILLQTDPRYVAANILLANIYKKTNQTEKAIRTMKIAIASQPAGKQRLSLEHWLEKLEEERGYENTAGPK